jgi:hypothetical protein
MMTKKISKVIVYYEDGTYEEVKASISDSQGEQNKKVVNPSPVIPDLRPDYYKIRDWGAPTWVPNTTPQPFTVTCSNSTDNIPLKYTVSSDARDMATWTFTSTGNADNLNKYTITSTGNGNVDLSR